MRATIFLLVMSAFMAFASCSEEPYGDDPVNPENPTDPDTPGDAEGVVKVVFDMYGSNAARNIVEVYSKGDPNTVVSREESSGDAIALYLESGVDYICLFWADDGAPNQNHRNTYDASSLKNISLNANMEVEKAFYGRLDIAAVEKTHLVALQPITTQVAFLATNAAPLDLKVIYSDYTAFNAFSSEFIGQAVAVSKTFNSSVTAGRVGVLTTFVAGAEPKANFEFIYGGTIENSITEVPLTLNRTTTINGDYSLANSELTFQILSEVQGVNILIPAGTESKNDSDGQSIAGGTTADRWITVATENCKFGSTDLHDWSEASSACERYTDANGVGGGWRLPTYSEGEIITKASAAQGGIALASRSYAELFVSNNGGYQVVANGGDVKSVTFDLVEYWYVDDDFELDYDYDSFVDADGDLRYFVVDVYGDLAINEIVYYTEGLYWTSTRNSNAGQWIMYFHPGVNTMTYSDESRYSYVRCVQDVGI